jgi:hypothetical protein
MYVIYKNPKDYPDKFVVRFWVVESGSINPGPLICLVDTIEDARSSIPTNVVKMPVFKDDDPVIEEVWCLV